MQVSVETTQGLERRLTITVPADSVDSAVKARLQQLSKTQRINGFRPGKVPVSVIQKRFGPSVRQEVAGDVMQRNFYQAIVDEKINPAGMPEFDLVKDEQGQDLEFVASFEVYPEVEVKGVDEIEIEKPTVEITDADLDNMMETLQKQHATWEDVDRAAKEDDRVVIDFVGTVDGEEFEGGKAEDFSLELGQNRMIPGFEEPLVGAKKDDNVTVEVTFPDDYQAEALKGKDAVFAVTVKKVEGRKLPEVNDEFATLFGVEDGGVDALKAEVRKNMERELSQTLKATVKEDVISKLLEKNEFDVPAALIDQEVNALREQAKQRFSQQGGGQNLPELPAELFKDNAVRRVRIGLLLGEIINKNELKADDDKVLELIEVAASAYEDPQEVVDYYKGNEELMQQMRNVALEEQAIEWVLETAKTQDVTKAFDDVMNKQG